MIVAAALCPAPPLLVPELTGAQEVAPGLRDACLASVAELMAATPDAVAVVGAADRTGTWSDGAAFDLARYAPGPVRGGQAGKANKVPGALPSSLGVGAWLLGHAGASARRILLAVGADEPVSRCAAIGAELAVESGRVALLVMADGSARRGLRAPGYLDGRSAGFDAEVESAVRAGQLDRLLEVDQVLARELMAAGRPAWQVLAGALAGRKVSSEIRYCDDPFGVAYLVASLRVEPEGAADE
ncbi:MAG TPA: hypothetical protein VFW16_01455 [Streptosporangiaceae bacterium]|nr:hypothetical protein [Streptosporangiaceae bacterium]